MNKIGSIHWAGGTVDNIAVGKLIVGIKGFYHICVLIIILSFSIIDGTPC